MKLQDDTIKKSVRDRYARAAKKQGTCCGTSPCGNENAGVNGESSLLIGYSAGELENIPEEANLGLGCGNPAALAGLKKGEVVLDLGSGAGIDCFLAARKVGPRGRVIGVDMTPEMIDKARENAKSGGFTNAEFRLGEIENLPVADSSIDAIISNCVINLSTDKPRVFKEAFRVLKPGGRLMVSDLALKKPLPQAIRTSVEVYVACVAGALIKDEYLSAIRKAGFKDVEVVSEKAYPAELVLEDSRVPEITKKLELTQEELVEHISSVLSLSVKALKPKK